MYTSKQTLQPSAETPLVISLALALNTKGSTILLAVGHAMHGMAIVCMLQPSQTRNIGVSYSHLRHNTCPSMKVLLTWGQG